MSRVVEAAPVDPYREPGKAEPMSGRSVRSGGRPGRRVAQALVRRLIVPVLALAILAGAEAAPRLSASEAAQLAEIAASERQPERRRAQAIRQLELAQTRAHLSLLRRLLREERSLDIRLAAACTLAAQGDTKSPRDLLLATAYEQERTPSCTLSEVMIALARTGEPAGAMHLERALQREAPADEPFYYQDVCRALSILNTPNAQKLLVRALQAGSPAVRYAAVSPAARLALDPASPVRQEAADALRLAASADVDEKVAEQAASALFWSGVDGRLFFRLLESSPEPKVRIRAARVMNRHYLSPARLQRLKAALELETDPAVRAEIAATIEGQKKPGQ